MMPFLKNEYDCTACSACQASCPADCIAMQADDKGFLYPVINEEKCLHCHRCEAVCPALHAPVSIKDIDKPLAFAAITKNEVLWQQSASGGAFGEICYAWGKENENNTWVFGATFDDLHVVHKGALIKHISWFHKSKYVQSRVDDCFRQIKKLLEQNKRIVFSGTPCQVAGLRNFLGNDHPNLLCIDLICHGVGSPAVFQRHLTELEQKTGKKISTYTFRAKRKCWGNLPLYQSEINYQDGSTNYYVKDNYNRLFLHQLCLRDSCGGHCRYRQSDRLGDFTIADFKRFIHLFPNIKDWHNYSTLICNTKKGNSILPVLQRNMDLLPCSIEVIAKYNPLFSKTTPENPQRIACLNDFANGMSVEQLVDKYIGKPRFSIFSWIKGHIPFSLKYYILRIYHKLCR